jgi:hypothetical protein
MILQSIEPHNFGPFSSSSVLKIEPDVTILTGQNDTGKSSILRLIELICRDDTVKEDDVNVYRTHEANTSWVQDHEIGCTATFITTKNSVKHLTKGTPPGDRLTVKFSLTPNKKGREIVLHIRGKDTTIQKGVQIRQMPKLLYLPLENKVSPIIDLDSNTRNPLEDKLLAIAFGENAVTKVKGMNDVAFELEREYANERLNNSPFA